eukprot:scaffold81737_cov74-Phaeocystis_antarctica.AAC.1
MPCSVQGVFNRSGEGFLVCAARSHRTDRKKPHCDAPGMTRAWSGSVDMAVDGSAVNKSITVEQMTGTVMSLTVADNETSTTRISITQDFTVGYDGGEGSVDKLVVACQAISPSCVERVTGRRRALLQSGSTTFPPFAERWQPHYGCRRDPELKSEAVNVSNSTLCSVNVQLS